MKRLLTTAAVLVLAVTLGAMSAAPASAQSGINLAWTDCSSAGADNMTFACNINTGVPFILMGSFVAPSGIGQFVGFEAVVDIGSNSDPIGPWWQTQTAGCRQGAAIANFNFTTGPFTCVDPFGGQAFGGVQFQPNPASTSMQAPLTNKGRFKVAAALSPSVALTGGTEYYAFALTLLRTNTLSCVGGCAEPACIRLNSVKLAQPAGVGDVTLTAPPAGGDQDVTWQGVGADCAAVPVQNRTWGEVKHLYR